MVRGLLCVALLLATVTTRAETWPDKDWAKGTPIEGPAVDALNAYAFPRRDDATRQGIRTDALLVIRDGEVIYERYAMPTTASTPHLTWSVSKSLMATVLGVAYGESRFKLSDPAAPVLPADETASKRDDGRLAALGLGPRLAGRLRICPAEILGRCDASTDRGAPTWRSSSPACTPPARRARPSVIPAATATCSPPRSRACSATRPT